MLCCGMQGTAHSATELRSVHRPGAVNRSGACATKMPGNRDNLNAKSDGNDDAIQFLSELLQNSQLQTLIKPQEAVVTPNGEERCPLSSNLSDIAKEVMNHVQAAYSRRPETFELLRLLNNSTFKSFMACHDQIAHKNFMPVLPDIPYEVDEDEDATVKVIRLVKSPSEPLGATLQVHVESGCILVARVMHGGVADRCGFIQSGDEVREVNGIKVLGKSPDEVIQLMSNPSGYVTLTLVPSDSDNNIVKECKTRVRAHYSYNPADDRSIPCHEAGLAFTRGDILEIVSQEDDSWWQARRQQDGNPGHAGLIPSRLLLQQRETMRMTQCVVDNKENQDQKSVIKLSPKLNKKLRKLKRPSGSQPTNETMELAPVVASAAERDHEDNILSYEEVDRYIPNCQQPRPIVLVGPPGIGRNELRRRLIASDVDHFKQPVPHTSREARHGELDGEEYHFVSRTEMENDILNKRYLEHGEYCGNLYGTTLGEVKSIINSGHVCILCPKIQALRSIRCSQLKPYIIFLRPVTSLDRLITSRSHASRLFTPDELKMMIKNADEMESQYGHYFDISLVNDDLETTANDLRTAVMKVETQPQWIPVSWMHR